MAEELIRIADFDSIELDIAVKNMTSGAEIKNGKRSYGGHEESTNSGVVLEIQLVEFKENGLLLEVPPMTGAVGHTLVVTVKTRNAPEQVEFFATCKVEKVDRIKTSGRERFTVSFVDYETIAWRALLSCYGSRQNQIEEFFQAVKG